MRKPWLLTKSIGSTYSVTPNSFFAESEGFEPPVQRNVYTAFRVRLFRPLRQLSLFSFAKVLLFFDIDKYYAIFLQNSFLPPAFTLYTLPPARIPAADFRDYAEIPHFPLMVSKPCPKTPFTLAWLTKALGSMDLMIWKMSWLSCLRAKTVTIWIGCWLYHPVPSKTVTPR